MVEKEDLDLVCVYVCVCVYIDNYSCSCIILLLCSFIFNWQLSLQTLSLSLISAEPPGGVEREVLEVAFPHCRGPDEGKEVQWQYIRVAAYDHPTITRLTTA